MATLSSPTITTNTGNPFLPKSPQLCSFKKSTQSVRSASRKFSCKATKNNSDDDQFQSIPKPSKNTKLELDRRNLLFGLGGMYGAAMTLGGGAADTQAAPVAPDFKACSLTQDSGDGSVGDHCCPPALGLQKVKDFEFEDKPCMKTRRPAHLVMHDREWLANYKRAIHLMKNLPMSDPRNFMQQARIHCAYCDGSYPILGQKDPNVRYEVHGSWLFAPFHRWYLYFFERILGTLIDKPDFALPYWNWDHPDGMWIPNMFKDIDSPLYDPNRSKLHQNKVINLNYDRKNAETFESVNVQIEKNLKLMGTQVVNPNLPSAFFGGPCTNFTDSSDQSKKSSTGALENCPHNNVHDWMGSDNVWSHQDMGSLWSAARDPIFYCHHANVDRMWSIWKNDLPDGPRPDIDDHDYRNSYFIFYDEYANPVKVYIKDSFDTEKLGYRFEAQELLWAKKESTPKPPRPPKPSTSPPIVDFPKRLDSMIKTMVKRPKKSRTQGEEEVLVISMDIAMTTQKLKYDVYINEFSDPKPEGQTEINDQFAGSFSSLGHRGGGSGMGNMTRKSEYKIAISSLLEDIGAENDEEIQVTLAPKVGTKNIVIDDLKIDFLSN